MSKNTATDRVAYSCHRNNTNCDLNEFEDKASTTYCVEIVPVVDSTLTEKNLSTLSLTLGFKVKKNDLKDHNQYAVLSI